MPTRSASAAIILRLGAAGCFAVTVWLVWVIQVILPGRNADQAPFWTCVACFFAALGGGSLLLSSKPRTTALRVTLALAAIAAAVLGAMGIASQVERSAAGGDFEGYVVLMGAGLLVHAAAIAWFLHVTRRPRAALNARASG